MDLTCMTIFQKKKLILMISILNFFQELKVAVKTTPEIVEVIGNAKAEQILNLNEDDGEEEVRLVLQSAFTDIMSVRKDVIAEVLAKLISRLNIEDQVIQIDP